MLTKHDFPTYPASQWALCPLEPARGCPRQSLNCLGLKRLGIPDCVSTPGGKIQAVQRISQNDYMSLCLNAGACQQQGRVARTWALRVPVGKQNGGLELHGTEKPIAEN